MAEVRRNIELALPPHVQDMTGEALGLGFSEADPETRIQGQAVTLGGEGKLGNETGKGVKEGVLSSKLVLKVTGVYPHGETEAGIKHLGIIPPEEEESWGIYIPYHVSHCLRVAPGRVLILQHSGLPCSW